MLKDKIKKKLIKKRRKKHELTKLTHQNSSTGHKTEIIL